MYKRGEVYYTNFSYAEGSEQSGMRPAVILQNNTGNTYSPTLIVAPITSRRKKDLPTHVSAAGNDNLTSNSMILLEQIRTVDKCRVERYVCTLNENTMKSVDKALEISLGMKEGNGDGKLNEIQIFNSNEFGEIRTVTVDGKPYFFATDVAKALGYVNPHDAISKHCRWVAKHEVPHPQSKTKTLEVNVIPQGDVVRLAAQSELDGAEKFESWIFDEVIPSVLNNGTYSFPQTTEGQIKLLAQGNVELSQKIESVNNDLQEFKKEMPLLAIECQRITEAKNKKIVPLLGGKGSNAYRNKSLRSRAYRDLEGQLKREFGVTSYKAIRRNQANKAIEIISGYELPMCLADEVQSENAQMNLT